MRILIALVTVAMMGCFIMAWIDSRREAIVETARTLEWGVFGFLALGLDLILITIYGFYAFLMWGY